MDETTGSVCYEIRVRGVLGDTLRGAFPDLRAQAHGSETVLTGPLTDQAALYGLLAQFEALGLELLEVRPYQQLADISNERDRKGGDHRWWSAIGPARGASFPDARADFRHAGLVSPGPYRMNAALMRLGRHERGIHVV